MLYGIIRVFLGVLIFGSIGLGIFKSKVRRKKALSLTFAILSIITISISNLFPVENLFITFDSPEEVFNYTASGKIQDIVYGEDSCLIFSSNVFKIIPKTEKGYKIPTILSSKVVSKTFSELGSFKIYNVTNTNDFYIWGTVTLDGTDCKVTDCNSSQIKVLPTKSRDTNYYGALIYGHITFSDGYYLLIDNKKISAN